jgi:transcriptional regulator with XRE-family HTH domain
MTFGTWLRAARQMNNLTQRELSGLTGVHNVTVSQYEHDRRLPTFEDTVVMATELGLNPHEAVARVVKARLLATEEGRIFLAEARQGRFYDDPDD